MLTAAPLMTSSHSEGLIIPIWGMIGWATKSGSLPQNLEYCSAKDDDGCSSHMVDGGNGFCFFGFGPDATLPPNCDTVVDEGKPGFGEYNTSRMRTPASTA